jgi:hypothetical protein
MLSFERALWRAGVQLSAGTNECQSFTFIREIELILRQRSRSL